MSFAIICAAARAHPSKSAIVYNGAAVSYATFAGAIGVASSFLQTQQLSPGCTVVVMIHNLLDSWTAVLALQALGLHTVCVKSWAVLDTLGLNDVAGIVTTAPETADHPLKPYASTGNRVIAIPGPAYDSADLPVAPDVNGKTKTGGHILYTSGTTGNYKKLFFSADLQRQRDAERIASHPFNADTIYHCANFGLWTGVGYKVPRTIWQTGGTVIIDQRPEWYRYYLQSEMTHAFLIPDMVNQLLNALDAQSLAAPPMEFKLNVAGGFISRKLAGQLIDRVTTDLINVYGSTETNVAVLESAVTNLDELHWLPSNECRRVEIIDECGNLCPVGAEGQLRIRLQELDCFSYLDDPQASEKVFQDGYLYPGDMAVRRADGRIRILGRSADVINFRGQKLSVAPIEYEIQNRLGVSAICLFSGINDEGEEVVIVMEAEQWPAQADLNNVGCEFAQFDQVRFAKVYPFPRTQTGTSKIDRIALRKLIFP